MPELARMRPMIVDPTRVDQHWICVKQLVTLQRTNTCRLWLHDSGWNLVDLVLQLVDGQDDVLEDLLGEGHGPDGGGGGELHEGGLGRQHPAKEEKEQALAKPLCELALDWIRSQWLEDENLNLDTLSQRVRDNHKNNSAANCNKQQLKMTGQRWLFGFFFGHFFGSVGEWTC